MSACEKCWEDASMAVMTRGGHQVEHYKRLLKEREDKPCAPVVNDHLGPS